MRACVRVVLLASLGGASLAGCDTVDSLREIPNALFVSGKHPVEPDNVSFENRMPEPTPVEEETSKPKQQPKSARRPKLSRTNEPRRTPEKPVSAQAAPSSAGEPQQSVSPQAPAQPSSTAKRQSAPSQVQRAPNRLKTLWPEQPTSGTFSR